LTKKNFRKLLVLAIVLGPLFLFFPYFMGAYVVLGLIDLSRHGRLNRDLVAQYFTGNGVLTWLLSPLNLLFDLLSFRRPYRLYMKDFPEQQRAEIQRVLDMFEAKKDRITTDLRAQMKGKRRGMLFYKWYGENVDNSVPEFNADFKYVKTIGVSVFNSRESTSVHFGPIRLTVRLLYNLTPRKTEKIFIEVNDQKHYWHDDPLFIFDDTIRHRSVNEEDGERYCVFVDVLRPSSFLALQGVLLKAVHMALHGINRIFYKNWDMLAK